MNSLHHRQRRLAFAWGLAAVLLSGCGGVSVNLPGPDSTDAASGQPRSAAEVKSRPTKKRASASSAITEAAAVETALRQVSKGKLSYKIGPADLLEVQVFREKNMERRIRVTPQGTITFPLVGSIRVGGLEIAEAEQVLVDKLKKYLIDPQVSVFIHEYGNKLVYVLGEVEKPGSYSLPTEAPLTVLEAVTLAGGFTQYAARDHTRVIRKEGGQNQNFKIEITAITERGEKDKDMVLVPNDVVFVPESFF